MGTMATIRYREFYDVPRVFLVRHKGVLFLFESLFDEKLDDYSPQYDVYMMPELVEEDLHASWEDISSKATRGLGTIPVSAVRFDPSKRRGIDAGVLEEIGDREGLW